MTPLANASLISTLLPPGVNAFIAASASATVADFARASKLCQRLLPSRYGFEPVTVIRACALYFERAERSALGVSAAIGLR